MLTMPCGKVRRCRRAEEGRDMVREAASRGGGGAADDAFVFDDVERLTLETEKKKTRHPPSLQQTVSLPVLIDAYGAQFVDIRRLQPETGICTYDDGFSSTGEQEAI